MFDHIFNEHFQCKPSFFPGRSMRSKLLRICNVCRASTANMTMIRAVDPIALHVDAHCTIWTRQANRDDKSAHSMWPSRNASWNWLRPKIIQVYRIETNWTNWIMTCFFFNLATPILTRQMTNETIRALEVRKNSMMAEKNKSAMQTLGANNAVRFVLFTF